MLHFGIKSRAPLEGKRNFVPCSGRYVSRNAGVFIKQGENDGLERAASTSCKKRERHFLTGRIYCVKRHTTTTATQK